MARIDVLPVERFFLFSVFSIDRVNASSAITYEIALK